MLPAPTDTGAPAAAPMARATSAFATVGFIDRTMSQSRETVQSACVRRSGGARPRSAVGLVNGDGRRVEERESRKQTPPNPKSIEEGLRGLVNQTP